MEQRRANVDAWGGGVTPTVRKKKYVRRLATIEGSHGGEGVGVRARVRGAGSWSPSTQFERKNGSWLKWFVLHDQLFVYRRPGV